MRRLAVILCFIVTVTAAAGDLAQQIDTAMTAGDFAAAKPLAEQWLKSQTGLNAARGEQVMGSIEDRLGNHSQAMMWLENAYRSFRVAQAGAHELAACAGEAAMAAMDPAQARKWQETALEHWLGSTPPVPGKVAVTRARLAEILLKSGKLSEATIQGKLAHREAGADPTALCLTERYLGIQAHTLGQWEQAVFHFSKARKACPALGAGTPAMEAALDGQMGQSLLRAGRRNEAEPLLIAAGAWFHRQDPSSSEALAALNNLAEFWLENDQPGRVIDRLEALLPGLPDRLESLTLYLNLAAASHRTGMLEKAAFCLQKVHTLSKEKLASVHPLRVTLALASAALAHDQGDEKTAAWQAREHTRHAVAWLAQAANKRDETKILEFRRTIDPIAPLIAFAGKDPALLANAVLSSKGAVFNLMLPQPQPGAMPDLDQLRASLPKDSALVDFIRWSPYRGLGTWETNGRYGALIIRTVGSPEWVDLGAADLLETRLRRFISAARNTVARGTEAADRASLVFQCQQLWQLAWAPVAARLSSTERILLRPDGMLHFIPWAVPRDENNQWFCHRYANWEVIAFPRPASPVKPSRHWRILAVPDAPSAKLAGFSTPLPDWLTPDLEAELAAMPALPGVTRESTAIREAAAGAAFPITLDFPEPTEAAFQTNADVIHFAGHGFARAIPAWAGGSLLQAGLVMNDFPNANPSPRDGILFTAEAAALPLSGTSLVVLSGCQTALGEWQAGEHFTGLRHAFLSAGAAAVASTLWDLNDSHTPEIVRRIYQHLASGDSPSRAVISAQVKWLRSPAAAALTPGVQAALAGAWTLESAGWTK